MFKFALNTAQRKSEANELYLKILFGEKQKGSNT